MPLEKSYHPKVIEEKHSEKWELEKSFSCGLSNGTKSPGDRICDRALLIDVCFKGAVFEVEIRMPTVSI